MKLINACGIRLALLFGALGGILSGGLGADEQPADTVDQSPLLIERAWDFGIGIGIGELSNPFIGADDVPTYLVFDVAIYGKRFFFDNGDLGFTLVDRPAVGVNLLATYSSERIYRSFFNDLGVRLQPGFPPISGPPAFEPPVSGPSAGDPEIVPSDPDAPGNLQFEVPDRNFALNVGLEASFHGSWGSLYSQFTQDISGAHDGMDVSLEYRYVEAVGRWLFEPRIGLNWKSDDLVDYYYGVRQEDNPAIDLSYTGKAAINASAGLSAAYRLTQRISVVANLRYQRFGRSIKNSPLITEKGTRSAFLGIFYQF